MTKGGAELLIPKHDTVYDLVVTWQSRYVYTPRTGQVASSTHSLVLYTLKRSTDSVTTLFCSVYSLRSSNLVIGLPGHTTVQPNEGTACLMRSARGPTEPATPPHAQGFLMRVSQRRDQCGQAGGAAQRVLTFLPACLPGSCICKGWR